MAGVSTYYEVSGQGDPVVMLHGALSGVDGWSLQVPALVSAGFPSGCPSVAGTPDTPEPFSYRSMALETAAFLQTAVGRRCHLVGWSDGAVVAALIAMNSPELVDRVVLIGAVSGAARRRRRSADSGYDVGTPRRAQNLGPCVVHNRSACVVH